MSRLGKQTEGNYAVAKRNLPQPFEFDKARFQDWCPAPSLRHFSMLMTDWVLTAGTHMIGQVILTAEAHESGHVASLYRFLSRD